ncbi:MAG: phenol hydroxylase subunit P4 [Burkholderiaceae bacterium]|jgi:phenol hydroxylase P4 protein
MSVAAIGNYSVALRDTAEHFAQPLLYVGWDEHMMFAAPLTVPLSMATRFEDLVSKVLPALYGQHPEFAQINWNKVQWFRSADMFTPRMQGTLAEQGFGHKSVLRFRTPGLEGIHGSCG